MGWLGNGIPLLSSSFHGILVDVNGLWSLCSGINILIMSTNDFDAKNFWVINFSFGERKKDETKKQCVHMVHIGLINSEEQNR